jgi:hypothetical protein
VIVLDPLATWDRPSMGSEVSATHIRRFVVTLSVRSRGVLPERFCDLPTISTRRSWPLLRARTPLNRPNRSRMCLRRVRQVENPVNWERSGWPCLTLAKQLAGLPAARQVTPRTIQGAWPPGPPNCARNASGCADAPTDKARGPSISIVALAASWRAGQGAATRCDEDLIRDAKPFNAEEPPEASSAHAGP